MGTRESLGRRRRIAAFPASARLDFAQVSYSCDDSWIHLCEWVSGCNFLIRVADGLVVALPVASTAMNWNPRNGPSAMIAMTLDAPTGRLVTYDYDLATNTLQHRSDLASPTGLPLSVRELSMSADGYLALVTAPVGVPGLEQAERGGVHVAAVIDVDDGSIEPVLPVSFRTRSAQRRHTSPRWCAEQARNGSHYVAVADQLMMDAFPAVCDPDSAEVSQDLLRRWTEVLAGITAAWEVGRIPIAWFANEYVQYAISCYELDEDAASQAVAALRQRARTDQAARTIIRALDSYRDRQWRPTAVLPVPEPNTPTGGTSPAEASITAAASTGVPEDVLTPALDRLIGAESIGAATAAARGLMQLAEPYRFRGGPWQVLAQASTEALARANFVLAAKLGLATAFWQAFFRPEMMASGLAQVPASALLSILLNCFEACTHLPERTVIGADAQSIFDVEEVRNRCQRALSDLPIADYLNTAPRNRVTAGPGTSRVPGPSDVDLAEGDSPVALRKRVFISYVHEDAEPVDRLASTLIAHGFDVWLDRTHLKPGMRWRSVISKEIRGGDFFIACFSPGYVSKRETFMNEELIIAINRLRRMHQSRQWFFPVKLAECNVPDYEIGPGETLNDLQHIDFSRD